MASLASGEHATAHARALGASGSGGLGTLPVSSVGGAASHRTRKLSRQLCLMFCYYNTSTFKYFQVAKFS